jgi:hypothetical protein
MTGRVAATTLILSPALEVSSSAVDISKVEANK